MRRILILMGCIIRHAFADDFFSQPVSLWERGEALFDIAPLPCIERSIRVHLPIYNNSFPPQATPKRS